MAIGSSGEDESIQEEILDVGANDDYGPTTRTLVKVFLELLLSLFKKFHSNLCHPRVIFES